MCGWLQLCVHFIHGFANGNDFYSGNAFAFLSLDVLATIKFCAMFEQIMSTAKSFAVRPVAAGIAWEALNSPTFLLSMALLDLMIILISSSDSHGSREALTRSFLTLTSLFQPPCRAELFARFTRCMLGYPFFSCESRSPSSLLTAVFPRDIFTFNGYLHCYGNVAGRLIIIVSTTFVIHSSPVILNLEYVELVN